MAFGLVVRRDMGNPLWINEDGGQPEYTAQSLRLSMSGLLTKGVSERIGARPGVIPNGHDAVSLSGVQVTVHDCNLVLNPALSAQDGPYIVHFTEHTHTLDPADGSNDRIDAVVARVYDDDHDGSGQREAVTEYVTGNPGPSPAPPSVPTGALLLARVTVPSDGTGSPSMEYVAHSTVASGGVLPVRSDDDLPTSGHYPGMVAYDESSDRLLVRSSDGWRPFAGPGGWETITPPGGTIVTGNDLITIPEGVYSEISITCRGDLTEEAFLAIRINDDDTSGLHVYGWNVFGYAAGEVVASGTADGTTWAGPRWSTSSSNWAKFTIFNTDTPSTLSYEARGGRNAVGSTLREYTIASGHLSANRSLSSIRFRTAAPANAIGRIRVWIEGRRA